MKWSILIFMLLISLSSVLAFTVTNLDLCYNDSCSRLDNSSLFISYEQGIYLDESQAKRSVVNNGVTFSDGKGVYDGASSLTYTEGGLVDVKMFCSYVKLDNVSGTHWIISKRQTSSSLLGFGLRVVDGTITCLHDDGVGDKTVSAGILSSGVGAHICCMMNSSADQSIRQQGWKDGVLVATAANTESSWKQYSIALSVGVYNNVYMNGTLDCTTVRGTNAPFSTGLEVGAPQLYDECVNNGGLKPIAPETILSVNITVVGNYTSLDTDYYNNGVLVSTDETLNVTGVILGQEIYAVTTIDGLFNYTNGYASLLDLTPSVGVSLDKSTYLSGDTPYATGSATDNGINVSTTFIWTVGANINYTTKSINGSFNEVAPFSVSVGDNVSITVSVYDGSSTVTATDMANVRAEDHITYGSCPTDLYMTFALIMMFLFLVVGLLIFEMFNMSIIGFLVGGGFIFYGLLLASCLVWITWVCVVVGLVVILRSAFK